MVMESSWGQRVPRGMGTRTQLGNDSRRCSRWRRSGSVSHAAIARRTPRAPRRTGRRGEAARPGPRQPVAGQVQPGEQLQAGQRAVGLGHRDRPVEPDHGRAGRAPQLVVPRRRSAASRCPPAVRAMACSAAISAWSRYGAAGASVSGVSSASASSISSVCHRERSWSGEQHEPRRRGPARRAGSAGAASAPAARRARCRSGSRSRSTRTSRIASPARSARSTSGPEPGA